MIQGITSLVVAAALGLSTVCAAQTKKPLTDLPVGAMSVVAPSQHADAAAIAARGGTALDIALAIVGAFAGRNQHIIQVNEGGEAVSAARVTVLRDGLLDDSLRGERWDIALAKTSAGRWEIREVKRAWRCWRGAQRERFAATPCR